MRVTVRLVALVMLPVTLMCALAGSVVMSHRDRADHALAVDRGVVELGHLVALRDAIHGEQAVQTFTVRFVQLGVSIAEAAAFLGVDWVDQVAPARRKALAAVRALGESSPVTEEALRRTYAIIDRQAPGSTQTRSELDQISEVVRVAAIQAFDRLELEAGDGDVVAALKSLRIASDLVEIATPVVIDLSAVWFPAPKDTPAVTAGAFARLETESLAYRSGLARLRDLGVAGVLSTVGRIDADPDVRALDEAVAATVAGASFTRNGAPIDDDAVASALRGHLVLRGLLEDVVDSAARAVHREAAPLVASEQAAYLRWLVGSIVVALTSVAIAFRLSRSISRPLEELARYARAVNDGDLDAKLLARSDQGPHETRMALAVFTDLVTNLKLLDAKANALAHCDFDDPVLLAPLPGRIGRSLDESVALLSGSIFERDELQTHLAHQATHDFLTGIANRPAALAAIEAAIARSSRNDASFALLFVDLNEFKSVNDSHGHALGDEVLREVGARLAGCVRNTDIAARLGGDEFVVIAESARSPAAAEGLAYRIIDAITRPIDIGVVRLAVGAAIGIAMTRNTPEEPLRLLARADAAMYRAKRHDRSAVEVFDADLQLQLVEREDVEAALTAAVHAPDGGGLHLLFQPVVDARSGAITGAEALIRWDRPDHGRLVPDDFVPIAEATALIIELDCWVLAAATSALAGWSAVEALVDIPLSVNISGRHLLSGRLPGHLHAVLEASGVDPHRLSIEITETVLLGDLAVAAGELNAVRALGVEVAIDDFGTGYTSLAHLQKLPVDTIKIDRSFTCKLNDRRGRSLVQMVSDLGHAIGMCVVAEGIETPGELSALRRIGVDHVQGFLLSRPLGAAALAAWAHAHRAGRQSATSTVDLSRV